MELYAAMVETLTTTSGAAEFLSKSGHDDDMLILFFSENGAEGNPIDRLAMNTEWLGRRFENGLANLGRVNSYTWSGPGWSQASRCSACGRPSPPRAACACRRRGDGSRGRRGRVESVVSIKDVAPTVLALAGMKHPGRAPRSTDRVTRGPLDAAARHGTAQAVHGPEFTMGGSCSDAARRAWAARRPSGCSSPTGPSAGSSTTSWLIRWSRRTPRPRSPRGSRSSCRRGTPTPRGPA